MNDSIWTLYGYLIPLLEGAGLTAALAILSLILAVGLGLLTALAKLSSNLFAKTAGTLYTTIIRGVPDLVAMLLLFYGSQILINQISDWLYDVWDIDFFIVINEFTAGVITIGLIFGAYMGETFRGAILAVDKGQLEAGHAFGLTNRLVFRRILIPQMLRHALPGLGNNWLVLLKTTAIVSVIGLYDMVRVAKDASIDLHKPFFFLIPVALIYLLYTYLSELGIKRLSARYNAGNAQDHF